MENRKMFNGVKSLRSDSEAYLKVFSVPSFMTVAYELKRYFSLKRCPPFCLFVL